MLSTLLRRRKWEAGIAAALYQACVDQTRRPAFYEAGVPDTSEGRFEVLAAHVFLVVRRLAGQGDKAADVSQALFDAFFDDLDAALREMGVGDQSVARKLKGMTEAFYGRSAAYGEALDAGDGDRLAEAVGRNILAGAPDHVPSGPLAQYLTAADAALQAQDAASLLSGATPAFPEPNSAFSG